MTLKMTELEVEDLRRQNDYLKLRNAQQQRTIVLLEAETLRLRQQVELGAGRGQSTQPNLLPPDR